MGSRLWNAGEERASEWGGAGRTLDGGDITLGHGVTEAWALDLNPREAEECGGGRLGGRTSERSSADTGDTVRQTEHQSVLWGETGRCCEGMRSLQTDPYEEARGPKQPHRMKSHQLGKF